MKFIIRKIKTWFLNPEEKKLLNNKIPKKNISKKYYSLIQCPQQEIFFLRFKQIIESEIDHDFGGIHPRLGYPGFISWLFILPSLLYSFHLMMVRLKWDKIYSSIGVKNFFKSNDLIFKLKLQNLISAIKYYKILKTKKDLLSHSFNGIYCGDLIYDSYLRFNKKHTISIKDLGLIIYIFDCYNQITYFQNLASKLKIKSYFTSYTTYIAHGIPVRVFLKNGVEVYSLAYINEPNYKLRFKKLESDDFYQVKPHWKYKDIFQGLINKQELLNIGLSKFKKRFKGEKDLDFMLINQYSKNYKSPKLKEKFDGVVFIGDFFDSQHIYRSIVFEDLYEWLIHTINLVLKNNLNVGFKTHPNQINESRIFLMGIQKKYSNISWIDPSVSNKIIFSSGIKFGVSVYGSVLGELALHNIKPICCGDNPTSNYNFTFEAKTLEEYDDLIINYKKLKFDKNKEEEIGEFYYMNMLYEGFEHKKSKIT